MLTRGQRLTAAAILLVAAGLPLILLTWSAARDGRTTSSVNVDEAVAGERVDDLAYAEVSLALTAFDVTSRSFSGRAVVCLGAFAQQGWRWIDTTAGQARRPAEAPRGWYGPDRVDLRIAGAPAGLQRDRGLTNHPDSPCYTGTVELNRGIGSFQLFPFDTYTVPTAIGVSLPAGSGLAPAVPAPGATLLADLPVVAAVGPDSALVIGWKLRADTRWVPTGVEGRVAVGVDPATGTIVCPASGPCAETDAVPPAPAAVFDISLRRTIQDVLFVIAVALCPLVFGGVLFGIARAGVAKGIAPPAAELASVGIALIAVLPVREVLVPSGIPGLTALDYMLGFELVLFTAATMLISSPPAPTDGQPSNGPNLRRRVLLGSRSPQPASPWLLLGRRRFRDHHATPTKIRGSDTGTSGRP